MKDIINKSISLVPAYLTDLLQLLERPKRFALERARKPDAVRGGLVFLALSFLLSWLIKASFIRGDPYLEFAEDAVFVMFQALLFGGVLWLAWRVVVKAIDLPKMFAIHFYYQGVVLLMLACWFMAVNGLLRAVDPEYHAALFEAVFSGNAAFFFQQPNVRHSALLVVPSFIILTAIGTWLFAGWGAYRQLNRTSRIRSTMAAALFLMGCVFVSALLFLIAVGALSASAPASSS